MNAASTRFLESVDSSWEDEHTRKELHALCARTGHSAEEELTRLAIEIAQRFDERLICHDVAMSKASVLYDAVFWQGGAPPALYEIYWALDEAEYRTDQDGSEENAPENRSRRCVKDILSKFASNDG
jgi:hypothetical protein